MEIQSMNCFAVCLRQWIRFSGLTRTPHFSVPVKIFQNNYPAIRLRVVSSDLLDLKSCVQNKLSIFIGQNNYEEYFWPIKTCQISEVNMSFVDHTFIYNFDEKTRPNEFGSMTARKGNLCRLKRFFAPWIFMEFFPNILLHFAFFFLHSIFGSLLMNWKSFKIQLHYSIK